MQILEQESCSEENNYASARRLQFSPSQTDKFIRQSDYFRESDPTASKQTASVDNLPDYLQPLFKEACKGKSLDEKREFKQTLLE